MKCIYALLLTACLLFNVKAHRSVTSAVLLEVRGGFNKNVKKAPVVKAKMKATAAVNQHHHEEHLMSAPVAIANVLADLCPHGMLPIAYGMAAGGGTGPVLATIILLVFGFLSWYSLVTWARAADATLCREKPVVMAESLSEVWERTVGPRTKFIPDLGCVALTLGCLLFYSAFLGDIFGSLVSGLPSLPPILRKRWTILLLLHAVPVLPLCLAEDLSSLQYSSMTGLLGIIYTVFFVGKRLVDGSYAPGGQFYKLMSDHLRPSGQGTGVLGLVSELKPFQAKRGLLVLMNMCCVAYACHYNSVKYFMELKTRTVPNLQKVMAFGLGGTALVFFCMMILGYATFGSNSQALLLNHYHGSQDIMATAARAFTGLAIVSGYALMFAGLKAALFSLLKEKRPKQQKAWSVSLLAIIATAACFVTEAELATVIGIVGSVFGSVVIYVFPAIVNFKLLAMKDKKGKHLVQPLFSGEMAFNKLMVVFGIIFAILGTWISLAEGGGHH